MKKYCKFCGSYLGDTKTCIDNEGNEINYFSIIAKKYEKLRIHNRHQEVL